MGIIGTLIVGAIIGAIAGAIVNRGEKMGCFLNIGAGLLGSFVGERLLPGFGLRFGGFYIIPSIIGAVIVVAVASALFGRRNRD